MDENIVVLSKMTYRDLKNFTWFFILKKGRQLKLVNMVFAAFYAAGLVACVVFWLIFGLQRFVETLAFEFLFLLLFPPAFYAAMNLALKFGYRKSEHVYSAENRFEFMPAALKAETSSGSVKGNAEVEYGSLYRIFEVNGAFYLFISRQLGYIVSKRNMDEKAVLSLRAFLRNKVGQRYVVCFRENA